MKMNEMKSYKYKPADADVPLTSGEMKIKAFSSPSLVTLTFLLYNLFIHH